MDLLADVLASVRLSGAVFFEAEFSEPWKVRSERSDVLARMLFPFARRLVLFHLVAEGACWAEIDSKRWELRAGDVIVLPYGDEHVMGAGSASGAEDIASLFPVPPPWHRPPCIKTGGSGPTTRIVCGFLHCDEAVFNPLLTALPRVLLASSNEGPSAALLGASLGFLRKELEGDRPGGGPVVARLVEALFVEVLRGHGADLQSDAVGWLAALKDEGIRRALELIHSEPEKDLTVARLARVAAMSRSVFHERFQALVGDSPSQYLTQWRLQRASRLLLEGDDGIALVAARVGYDSEAAFSRAFKRFTGEPPAAWRKRRTAG